MSLFRNRLNCSEVDLILVIITSGTTQLYFNFFFVLTRIFLEEVIAKTRTMFFKSDFRVYSHLLRNFSITCHNENKTKQVSQKVLLVFREIYNFRYVSIKTL